MQTDTKFILSFLLRQCNNTSEVVKKFSISTELKNQKNKCVWFKNIMKLNCKNKEN